MIHNDLMKEFQVQKVWSCCKRDERFTLGYVRAFLASCEDGRWLVVTPETPGVKSVVMILNTRPTAIKRLREQGFWTRVTKIYSC